MRRPRDREAFWRVLELRERVLEERRLSAFCRRLGGLVATRLEPTFH